MEERYTKEDLIQAFDKSIAHARAYPVTYISSIKAAELSSRDWAEQYIDFLITKFM